MSKHQRKYNKIQENSSKNQKFNTLCCISSSCVPYNVCCQLFWIVLFWLPFRYSLMFIVWQWRNCSNHKNLILLEKQFQCLHFKQSIGLIVHHFDLCDITILLQKPFYKHTFYLQSYLFHMEKIFEISSNQKALVCHIGGQIYIHSVLHTDNRPLIYSFPRLN